MSDDEAFKRFLLQPSEGYARLYPSIISRMQQAYENGNPMVKQAVMAMATAMTRAQGHRENRLKHEHGLTVTEARIVLHLVDGGTVASAAETMAVADSTVRSHLKAVFAKTGVKRQAELQKLF